MVATSTHRALQAVGSTIEAFESVLQESLPKAGLVRLWKAVRVAVEAFIAVAVANSEQISLAAQKIYGKSSERHEATPTQASDVLSALVLSGLHASDDNDSSPSESTKPSNADDTQLKYADRPASDPNENAQASSCSTASPEATTCPNASTCIVLTSYALSCVAGRKSKCSDEPSPVVGTTSADPAPELPNRRSWYGDWLTSTAECDVMRSKLDSPCCRHCGGMALRSLPAKERCVVVLVREHVRLRKVVLDRGVCKRGCPEFFVARWPQGVEKPLFEQALPDVNLVARLIVDHSKYGMAVYTQWRRFCEGELKIPYEALLRWRDAGIDLLVTLHQRMQANSAQAPTLIVDDTRYMSLNNDAKVSEKNTIAGHMWGKTDNKTFVYFGYAANWKASFLDTFLKGFHGVLLGDAYAGYAGYVEDHNLQGHASCNDHSRRKFVDGVRLKDQHAEHIVTRIGEIYHLEDREITSTMSLEELVKHRQDHELPIFEELKVYTQSIAPLYPRKSTMSRAIAYFLRHYDQLTFYTGDGRVPISTAPIERMMRFVAKTRKNSLFAGSLAGAKRLAVNLSFMATCELIKIDYFDYLIDVLPKLNSFEFPNSRVHELLPHQWAMAREAQKKKSKTA